MKTFTTTAGVVAVLTSASEVVLLTMRLGASKRQTIVVALRLGLVLTVGIHLGGLWR
jgi:hypothetical protein